MKRSLSVLVATVSLGSSPLVMAQDGKFGYVDLQRALMETDEGRAARNKLKKIFDQKQKELDERQEALKKSAEDLDKKRTLLPADKVRETEAGLQKQLAAVQEMYVRHQRDMQQREQEETGKIFDKMQRIIVKIASTENLAMVLDKTQAGIVFAKPHLDLTNELIRRYNAGEGGGAAPAAAKPAQAPAKK
jgi:outer membrane protein